MTARGFRVARLEALDRIEGDVVTIPVRLSLGISAFGVNAYAATAAGERVIEEHDELGAGAGRHEELYLVLSGRARFTLAGEEVDAAAGTFVFVEDPAVRRGAEAVAEDTVVLVVGGSPGRAFEPSPWEAWLEAAPLYRAKDFDSAAAVLARALERHPDNPNVLYNLACLEALAGRRDEALDHLGRAAELDPRVTEWSRSDSDLDPIRDDARFPA